MFLDALFQLEIGKLTRFQTDCRRHTSNGGFKFQKLEADFLASKYIFSRHHIKEMCIEHCARYHHSEAYSCNCIDKTKTFYREGSALPAAEWHHDLTLHRGWMHSGAKFVSVCKKALSCPFFPIMHRSSILFHSELSPDGVVSHSDITPWHHTITGCSCMTSHPCSHRMSRIQWVSAQSEQSATANLHIFLIFSLQASKLR